MTELAILIPLFPLIGFLITGLAGKRLSGNVAGSLATIFVFASFFLTLSFFLKSFSADFNPITVHVFDWINVFDLRIPFDFLLDRLSLSMMMIVTGIGAFIHLYSIGYMHHDERVQYFFSYLNLFLFFMLLLVMGANYLILFIGWEGVGLCSYLLIGFWFRNQDYNNAAKKAFIMNRIGDLGFLLGMFMLLEIFGTLTFSQMTMVSLNDPQIIIATILLFIGATGKSAQLPLYTWLPDAMAGPTPVSALIHAATMVTAGIYLIARSNLLFTAAPLTQDIILYVGLATALFAATIGLKQNDIKKVLAYSTVSQLGFMFVALGLGAYTTAFFHLLTHAFFKGLLFLGSGSVIHAMSGEQDMRLMGGLKKYIPATYFTFLVGTIAISGIPPFAGFFSKDEILAEAFAKSPLIWGALLIGSGLTAFYMFRLFFLTFHGEFRGSEAQREHLHESPATMTIPLVVLAVCSALAGFIGMPAIFGTDHFLKNFMEPVFAASEAIKENVHHLDHSTEWILMGASVLLAVIMILLARNIYVSRKHVPAHMDSELSPLARLISNKYYVDEIYEVIFVKPFMLLSDVYYHWMDLKVIDGIVNFTGTASMAGARVLRKLQNGGLGFYIFAMVIGLVLILGLNYLVK